MTLTPKIVRSFNARVKKIDYLINKQLKPKRTYGPQYYDRMYKLVDMIDDLYDLFYDKYPELQDDITDLAYRVADAVDDYIPQSMQN